MPNIFQKTIKAVFSSPKAMRAGSIRDDSMQFTPSRPDKSCPIYDSNAAFWSFGRSPREKALYPKSETLKRHHLSYLFFDTHRENWQNKRILHFALLPGIDRLKRSNADYTASDLYTDGAHDGNDVERDITATDDPDASYDIVIANHALEHLDADKCANPKQRS